MMVYCMLCIYVVLFFRLFVLWICVWNFGLWMSLRLCVYFSSSSRLMLLFLLLCWVTDWMCVFGLSLLLLFWRFSLRTTCFIWMFIICVCMDFSYIPHPFDAANSSSTGSNGNFLYISQSIRIECCTGGELRRRKKLLLQSKQSHTDCFFFVSLVHKLFSFHKVLRFSPVVHCVVCVCFFLWLSHFSYTRSLVYFPKKEGRVYNRLLIVKSLETDFRAPK